VAKISMPEIDRSWKIVGILALVLTVLVFIDRGGVAQVTANVATGSTGCQVVVVADSLNVRAGPSETAPVIETLHRDSVRDAQKTVQNGYRLLQDNRWAANQYLAPTLGSVCS
jgi:hypothetical protein